MNFFMHRCLFAWTVAILVVAGVAGAAEPVAPVPSVADEFRQTLLRLAQSGRLAVQDLPLHIERPAERVVNFGLLVDRDHDEGLLVLGTLPGGSAERMGLRAGDRLLAANGVDLAGSGGSVRMRTLLDSLKAGDVMDLRVVRDGKTQRVAGDVEVIELPAMRIELGRPVISSVADSAQIPADAESICGRISTFDVAPRGRGLFPVLLIKVDGEQAGSVTRDNVRLSPGRHELLVSEAVDDRQFSAIANRQRAQADDARYKTLTIDVQPGVTYLLAARFHQEHGGNILDGSYWEPVIWNQRPERCR